MTTPLEQNTHWSEVVDELNVRLRQQ
ncbi:hypothetical protein HH219_07005 [Pseudoalteromonas sp. NEC-BIFX-2020_015]|nr:hypothetical protein [Pseudoalteromonas sp. NEC-BIFX-2020_015]